VAWIIILTFCIILGLVVIASIFAPKDKLPSNVIDLETLKNVIHESWDKDTCLPSLSDIWKNERPFLGQSAATALVVQDYLGGVILYCEHFDYYWNCIDDKELDLCRDEFILKMSPCPDFVIINRDKILHRVKTQYETLKTRVEQKIAEIVRQ